MLRSYADLLALSYGFFAQKGLIMMELDNLALIVKLFVKKK